MTTTVPLKRVVAEIDVRAGSARPPLLSVSIHHGVVPRSEITDDLPRADDLTNYKVCQQGDLVLNRMRAFQGAIGVSPVAGLVSPDYLVLRPRSAVSTRYLHHAFRSSWFVGEMTSRIRGIGSVELGTVRTPRINAEDLLAIEVPLPTADGQRRIADFLDDQVARIDNVIAARRAQADLTDDLWSEQVRDEVSRGSWPRVPLWTVVRWQEGPGILAKDFRDEGIPILRIAHLRAVPPSLVGGQFVDAVSGARTWGHFRTEVGDLMLSGSASVGELAVWVTPEISGAIPYTGLIKARVRDQRLVPEYMRYFFLSKVFGDQIDLLKSGIGIQHWGPSHLSQVRIPLAPVAQQQRIIGTLRLAERDREIQCASLVRSVGLLEELKRSLITAAVTEEFDVSSADGSRVLA